MVQPHFPGLTRPPRAPRITLENNMTRLAIVQKLTSAEKELRRMEVRLKKQVTRGGKRPFAGLRGLWKGSGTITEEDIKKAEIRCADDA